MSADHLQLKRPRVAPRRVRNQTATIGAIGSYSRQQLQRNYCPANHLQLQLQLQQQQRQQQYRYRSADAINSPSHLDVIERQQLSGSGVQATNLNSNSNSTSTSTLTASRQGSPAAGPGQLPFGGSHRRRLAAELRQQVDVEDVEGAEGESGAMFANYSSLHGHYSSSQAHLQSLTSPTTTTSSSPTTTGSTFLNSATSGGPTDSAAATTTTLRKTPKMISISGLIANNGRQQQSQPTNSTKPMTTSTPNVESSSSSHLPAPVGRQLQHRSGSTGGQLHAPPLLLPPPYSAVVDCGSAGSSSAAIAPAPQASQQQQVICQQPGGAVQVDQAAPLATTATTSPVNQPQNARLSATSVSNSFPAAGPSQRSHQQQRLLGLLTSGQQQYPLLHPASLAASGLQAATNTDPALAFSLYQHQQQARAHFGAGSSKSKSCLSCADISIKWYIVVIALLGLICALIGTIVGAVHSAGRDYISLALLLLGKFKVI